MSNDGLDELEPGLELVEEAGDDKPPAFVNRFSAFVIDKDTYPALYCANGHVVEWRHRHTNVRLAVIYRLDDEAKIFGSVCAVCGEDGPVSEGLPDGAQEDGD